MHDITICRCQNPWRGIAGRSAASGTAWERLTAGRAQPSAHPHTTRLKAERGRSGPVEVTSGYAKESGTVRVASGDTHTSDSGDVELASGQVAGLRPSYVSGSSGSVSVYTSSVYKGNTGDINITTGDTTYGNSGDISLEAVSSAFLLDLQLSLT